MHGTTDYHICIRPGDGLKNLAILDGACKHTYVLIISTIISKLQYTIHFSAGVTRNERKEIFVPHVHLVLSVHNLSYQHDEVYNLTHYCVF